MRDDLRTGEAAASDSTSSEQSAASGSDGGSSLVAVLRANRRAAVMLVLAVATGLGAWWLFPDNGPVTVTDGLRDIQLLAANAPDEVSVYLTPNSTAAGMDVRVELIAANPSTDRPTLKVPVNPATQWGSAGCDPNASCQDLDAQTKQVTYQLSAWTQDAAKTYTSKAAFTLPEVGSNEASNDEFVTAVLPNLRFFQGGYIPTPLHDLRIEVAIPDGGRYTWTGSAFATPLLDSSFVSWDFTSSPGATITANGISLAAQDRDTKRTFLSGALLGVAGGALVGVLPELKTSGEGARRRRRRRRDRTG